MKIFILISILAFNFVNIANALEAASGSSSAIQTAVNTVAAGGGGTVTIPAGTFNTFTGQVTIPKVAGGIAIIGAGKGVTVLSGGGGFDADLEGVGKFRISGFTYIGPAIANLRNAVDFRIDHIRMETSKQWCYMLGIADRSGHADSHGVIDHCELIEKFWPNGCYGIFPGPNPWPNTNRIEWLGTNNNVFVEDCLLEKCYHPMDSFDGGRYVLRYSTVVDLSESIGGHGPGYGGVPSGTERGTRCIEVYCNLIYQSPGEYGWGAIHPRSGGGVVFHNIVKNFDYMLMLQLEGSCYTMSGGVYPGFDQIHDYWIWDNKTEDIAIQDVAVDPAGGHAVDFIQLDRDYFLRAPNQTTDGFIYTPFPYPHYLVTGDTPTVTYNLTTSVSPSGAGTVSGGGNYTTGASVQVTATANSGYTFTSWTGDATGTTNPVTVTMSASKSVTATFSSGSTSYTLTTAVSPTGGGTVTLSPAGVPAGSYTAGTTVTVTATPATGYTFTSWTGSATGTTTPITVTVDANKTVTATFTAVPPGNYTLLTDVSPTGSGAIALSPTGGVYTAGTSVQVTATAASGYTFSSWIGDATGTDNPVTVVVDSNKSVIAYFVAGTNPDETSEVIAYPNPFIPSVNANLKFKGTNAEDAEVRIYLMSGELLRTLQKEEGSGGELSWDGKNEAGEKVSGGIYIYKVTGGEKNSTGRIAIIR